MVSELSFKVYKSLLLFNKVHTVGKKLAFGASPGDPKKSTGTGPNHWDLKKTTHPCKLLKVQPN